MNENPITLNASWQEGSDPASTVKVECNGNISWCLEQVQHLLDKHKVAVAVKAKNPQLREEQFPVRGNGKNRPDLSPPV